MGRLMDQIQEKSNKNQRAMHKSGQFVSILDGGTWENSDNTHNIYDPNVFRT